MTDALHAALLPEGFYDVLPPEAAQEAAVIERMMTVLGGHGYDRVKPPLVEFEDTLLSGVGASMARHTFRLMDPMGSRMLGLRADMTVQIARIARSRLAAAARPLRLAYAGQVMQVRGTQLRPERQFAQVGAELIGGAQPAADAEAALLAVEALQAVGVDRLALDLTEPTLVPALLGAHGVEGEAGTALRHALDRKDAAAIAQHGGAAAVALGALLAASGPADAALAALGGIDLPAVTRPLLDRLAEVVRRIRASAPELMVTVDFVEHRGFEYHSGVAFTLFARGARGEVGRGGRYRANGAEGEEATGFTLYMDTVLRAAAPSTAPRRAFLPFGTAHGAGAPLRAEGYVTIAGLEPGADPLVEARRLGCGWVLRDGRLDEIQD
ncbi:ATP phosphoribosyltransferase regulatory subunit [Inquilinus ginsengisoli]|uniref:ATP phosphoribosyltransferase regulatory subunit n=1 Tax=Inquilinus ginsengisoli TaxID=363840 RepID=A0ABU1JPZ0_9PROT|nr:ATP phosphoribosyltransferase regulatory subunit [Inquilinus ginsengisoli]MDR6290382.1 ATP phosphoribosyltransferase regulatory subunit [Inquilinus ginsengisoli]